MPLIRCQRGNYRLSDISEHFNIFRSRSVNLSEHINIKTPILDDLIEEFACDLRLKLEVRVLYLNLYLPTFLCDI